MLEKDKNTAETPSKVIQMMLKNQHPLCHGEKYLVTFVPCLLCKPKFSITSPFSSVKILFKPREGFEEMTWHVAFGNCQA